MPSAVSARSPNLPPLADAGVRREGIHTPPRLAVDLEVVVPALNEQARITRTLQALSSYLSEKPFRSAIVVVDNGSVDRTPDVVADLAPRLPVHVDLVNCGRRGKGAAVRRGVLTSQARFVGFCDADMATPVESLDTIWALLEQGASVVIGSRRVHGAAYQQSQPLRRRIGGWGFRRAAGLAAQGIRDTQCGFKFFERRAAQALFAPLRVEGFAFDVEVLALALRQGLAIVEVPVRWSDREGSTLRPLHDGVRAVYDALTVAAHVHGQASIPRWAQSETRS